MGIYAILFDDGVRKNEYIIVFRWQSVLESYSWFRWYHDYGKKEDWRELLYNFDQSFMPYFDLNFYHVWVVENRDKYGSPLVVCPWGHLPLDKVGPLDFLQLSNLI